MIGFSARGGRRVGREAARRAASSPEPAAGRQWRCVANLTENPLHWANDSRGVLLFIIIIVVRCRAVVVVQSVCRRVPSPFSVVPRPGGKGPRPRQGRLVGEARAIAARATLTRKAPGASAPFAYYPSVYSRQERPATHYCLGANLSCDPEAVLWPGILWRSSLWRAGRSRITHGLLRIGGARNS